MQRGKGEARRKAVGGQVYKRFRLQHDQPTVWSTDMAMMAIRASNGACLPWGGSKEGVGAGGCSFVYHIPSCIVIIGLGTGVHLLGETAMGLSTSYGIMSTGERGLGNGE